MNKHRATIATIVLVIAGLALGFAAQRLFRSQSAAANVDAADACIKEAQAFSDYPLVFPGKTALGYPLVGCQRSKTEERLDEQGRVAHAATDFFTFDYGSCAIPEGLDSCAMPVTIVVDPPCGLTVDRSVVQETRSVRGVETLVKLDGSVRVEAPTYKVSIFPPEGGTLEERQANAVAILESLVPANAQAAALTADAPLSTSLGPSSACP